MKQLDYLKNLPAPARMLFRPMLMISLVLHGIVLMLPIPSDLSVEKPKTSKQYKQVKIAQLPTTRSSPNSSPQSSAKPNPQTSPQPSQSILPKLSTRRESSSELNPQLSPQLSQPTPLDLPTRPKSTTTRRQSAESPVPIRKSSSQSEQQPKNEEEQQQPTEQPKRSLSDEQPTQSQPTEQPTPSQPTEQPTPSQPTEQPTPSQPTEQPTPSQPTEQPTQNNETTGGGYTDSFNKNQNQIWFEAAIEQVKRDSQDKLKQFKTDQDINKLTESDKFKDANGNPVTKFEFLQKAVSPLTTQDITSALEKQLSSLEFRFAKIGTYGGGPLYEVTKGDFKRYLIFAPGKDEQGEITAIIISQVAPP